MDENELNKRQGEAAAYSQAASGIQCLVLCLRYLFENAKRPFEAKLEVCLNLFAHVCTCCSEYDSFGEWLKDVMICCRTCCFLDVSAKNNKQKTLN